MKLKVIGLVLLGMLLTLSSVSASSIVIGTGSFQSGYTIDQNGNPYWDSPSADGSQKNIGYFVTGTGAFAGDPNSPGAALDYWGFANGAADANYYFTTNNPNYTATLLLEVAGLADNNVLGWYDVDEAGVKTLNQIFAGTDSPTQAQTFTPSANFGFYIFTGDGNTYFTQSSLNIEVSHTYNNYNNYFGNETTHQHFTLFDAGPGSYLVGVEDRSLDTEKSWNAVAGAKNIGDFNDLAFRFTEIPEPSTYALIGIGLVGLGLIKRRKIAA